MAFQLSRQAAHDIIDIYRCGAEQFGAEQADTDHALLESTFSFLARHPLAARKRLELSPPVHIHPVQSHLVTYRQENNGDILIVRVRHSREDWADPLTET